jgi:hypothetical protein
MAWNEIILKTTSSCLVRGDIPSSVRCLYALVLGHEVTGALRRRAVCSPSGLRQPGRGRYGNEIPAPLQPRRQPQGKWRRAGRVGLRRRRQHGECCVPSKILRSQPRRRVFVSNWNCIVTPLNFPTETNVAFMTAIVMLNISHSVLLQFCSI